MLEVGPVSCCCYIVSSDDAAGGGKAVIIDPGGDADRIDAALRRLHLEPEAILLTHSHADHIGAVEELLAEWPGLVLACSAETSRRIGDPRLNLSVMMGQTIRVAPAGRILADGEEFSFAGLQWRAVEVPGHDPGEMVFILGDGHQVFTGDAVFEGSIGRSDFPGGDGYLLVEGVKALLSSLPVDGILYPGHGGDTRVGLELAHNPFLR